MLDLFRETHSLEPDHRELVAGLLNDARAATSTRDVGEIGEAIAHVWFVAQGWELFLQDLGERGVDAGFISPDNGDLLLVEVKTTRTGARFRTSRGSPRQGSAAWVHDRLERIGYTDLDTALELVGFLGVLIDVAAKTITLYEPRTAGGRRWVPIAEPISLVG